MNTKPSGQADGRTSGQSAVSVHLSVDETAALLNTTPRSVRRFIADGTLPALPDPNGGRGRVVPSEAAHAFKADREADARTDKETDGHADTKRVRPPVRKEFVDERLVEHLRGEVEFLRARNAELNAVVMQQARALAIETPERAAIEAAPTNARTGPESPQGSSTNTYRPNTSNGPQTAPERDETGLSYGDIADWLDGQTGN